MMNCDQSHQSWLESYAVLVGMDWADQKHVFYLEEVKSGSSQSAELAQTPEAIDEWASDLRRRFPGQRVAVCLEQKRGPLVAALMQYEFIELYPINPKRLKSYREAFTTSGAVDDPTDARLLWSYLSTHGHLIRNYSREFRE